METSIVFLQMTFLSFLLYITVGALYAFYKLCVLVGSIISGFAFRIIKGVLNQTEPRTAGIVDRNGAVVAALPLIAGTSDHTLLLQTSDITYFIWFPN